MLDMIKIERRGGSLNRCISPQKVNNTQLWSGSNYIGEVGPFLSGGDILQAWRHQRDLIPVDCLDGIGHLYPFCFFVAPILSCP